MLQRTVKGRFVYMYMCVHVGEGGGGGGRPGGGGWGGQGRGGVGHPWTAPNTVVKQILSELDKFNERTGLYQTLTLQE